MRNSKKEHYYFYYNNYTVGLSHILTGQLPHTMMHEVHLERS